jgi:DnaK suppressor protein
MTEEQRKRIEERLVEERERSLRTLEVLKAQAADAGPAASGELSDYPLHIADLGTQALERQQSLALAGQEGRHFDYIEAALDRLYRDPAGFGRCEVCGREIPFERLLAVPHTRYCLECKLRIEEAR